MTSPTVSMTLEDAIVMGIVTREQWHEAARQQAG